jgi:hypothetical protein
MRTSLQSPLCHALPTEGVQVQLPRPWHQVQDRHDSMKNSTMMNSRKLSRQVNSPSGEQVSIGFNQRCGESIKCPSSVNNGRTYQTQGRMPTSPRKSSKPREDNVVSSYLAVNKGRTLNVSKVEKFELINLDSPFHSESKRLSPPNSAFGGSPIAQSSRQEFETIWARFEDPKGAARGWSSSPPSTICTGLRETLPHYKLVVAPDSQSPFIEGAYTHRS